MSTPCLPASYSLLRPDALLVELSEHYDLAAPRACDLLSCGLIAQSWSDVYRVTAGPNRYILNVYDSATLAEVAAQAEVVAALALAGLPVPAPIARRDGAYASPLIGADGPRVAVLWRFLPGSPPDVLAEVQAEEYGLLVTRLHAALDSLPLRNLARWSASLPTYDLTTLIAEPLVRLRPVLTAASPSLATDLEHLMLRVRARLEALSLPREAPAWGFIHGDLHKRNVLVAPGMPLAIIDWETLGLGWRAYDLAALRRSLSVLGGWEGSTTAADDLVTAYLRGYTSLHPLSAAELEALPFFVAARHLWIQGDKVRLAHLRGLGLATFDTAWCETLLTDLRAWLATVV